MKLNFVKNLLAICLSIIILSACGQDDIVYQLNSKQVQLNCDRTFVLQVSPAIQGLTYTSLNPNIATVNGQGLITAKLVGTTKIVIKDSLNVFNDTVVVTVNTQFTSFRDPSLCFGSNDVTVYNQMKAYNYEYYFYSYTDYNYWYFYDPNVTDNLYYIYYFSKSNKLIFCRIQTEDFGDLDWHLTTRYSLLKNYHIAYTYIYSDSTTYSYTVDNTYYISPDSSLIVLFIKNSDSQSVTIFYLPANETVIQRILNTDDEEGDFLYSWFISYYLYPDSNQTIDYVKQKKRPEISTMPLMPSGKRLEIKPDFSMIKAGTKPFN